MRMEGKDNATGVRPVFDPADGAIAICHRKWKIPTLHGRAHGPVFAFRHAALEYEPFSATADPGKERMHGIVIGPLRDLRRTDLGPPWASDPERAGGRRHLYQPCNAAGSMAACGQAQEAARVPTRQSNTTSDPSP